VNALADAYLTDAQRRMKPNSFRIVRDFTRSFASTCGQKSAESVRKADVEAWVRSHPTWGQTTVSVAKVRVLALFHWAVEQELLAINPIQGLKKPPQRSRGAAAVISPEDHARLMEAATPSLRDVLFALRESGARPGEVCGVRAADFHAEQGVWILEQHKTADKTGKPRVIFLTPALIALCRTLAERYPTGPLFRTMKGKPWAMFGIAKRLRLLRMKLGIEGAIPYGYRHGFATDALANGVPDAHVAALLGHSGTAMLHKHYSHLTARSQALRDALGKVR
jgi:integrase